MIDVVGRQAGRNGIVGAPAQDDMHKGHAGQQGDYAPGHDPILHEQLLRPDVATADAHQDDGQGEAGAPPRHQQARVILDVVLRRRGSGVELAHHEVRGRGKEHGLVAHGAGRTTAVGGGLPTSAEGAESGSWEATEVSDRTMRLLRSTCAHGAVWSMTACWIEGRELGPCLVSVVGDVGGPRRGNWRRDSVLDVRFLSHSRRRMLVVLARSLKVRAATTATRAAGSGRHESGGEG